MPRWRIALAATAALILLSNVALAAQGKGGGASKAPKTQSAPSVKPAQTTKAPAPAQAPKVTKATAPAPKVTKATAPAPKATNAAAPAPRSANARSSATTTKSSPAAKPDVASAKATGPKAKTDVASAKATRSGNTKTATTATTANATVTATSSPSANTGTTTSTTNTTGTTTLTATQQKLQKNTNLAAKLRSRLPAGTDLMTASAGFKNLGQFVAAVNVSSNLGIPFTQLKTKMVDDGLSLGQSIQTLKPTVSGTVEAQRAEYDARGMIYESEQTQVTASVNAGVTTTTTTTTSSSKKKPKPSGGSND